MSWRSYYGLKVYLSRSTFSFGRHGKEEWLQRQLKKNGHLFGITVPMLLRGAIGNYEAHFLHNTSS